jgi:hypothetical protein
MRTLPLLAILVLPTAFAAEPEAKPGKGRAPRPDRFALVFSFGYGDDLMPTDAKRFANLLEKLREAGFNTVHARYSDIRLDECRKHKIKLMVDLLDPGHHVYKAPEKAKALCEKLRSDQAVWGYNLWNDVYRKTTAGRLRDIESVRQWDPTHPAYSGTYRTDGMRGLTNPDIFGYYDFHWKRGLNQHFPHLLAYRAWAIERDARFYSWMAVTSGIAGKGNRNRSMWSAHTAIACGQKGILWFLGQEMMDPKTLKWNAAGDDIVAVNRSIAPLAEELARLGNPTAIYSTPVTRTANNDPLPGEAKSSLPPGLEKNAFPTDFWVQPAGGEWLVGVYEGEGDPPALYLANHNAYVAQEARLKIKGRHLERFDADSRTWKRILSKDDVFLVPLEPGGGALLRSERRAPKKD